MNFRHRLGICVPAALLLTALFIAPQPLIAQTPDVWGSLTPGPYAIGFETIETYDYSRSFGPKYDYFGNLSEGEHGRPIQVCIWYPAEAAEDALPMVFGEYAFAYPADSRFMDFLGLLQNRSTGVFAQLFGGNQGTVLDLMSLPVAGARNLPHRKGSFPLVVYSPDSQSGVGEGFILCEYLASHGYVVAATHSFGTGTVTTQLNAADLETLVYDREFVLGIMHDYPNVDHSRTAVVGVGFGGLAGLLLRMHNLNVDAVVSLDGLFVFPDYVDLALDNPYFDPVVMSIPVLEMHVVTQPPVMTVVDTLIYSDRHTVAFTSLNHLDLSSYGIISSLANDTAGPSAEVRHYRHEVVCDYVLNFLDARLKKEPAALAFLDADPEVNGIDPDFMTISFHAGQDVPPTSDQFLDMVQNRGIDTVVSIVEEFNLFDPANPILPELTVNALGYQHLQRGDLTAAVTLLRLGAQAYPYSANAWDSYGEASLAVGDNDGALRCYKKALEILPTDSTTPPQLKALIEANAPGVIERLEAPAETDETSGAGGGEG